jgi:hypothetical protein
MTTRTRPQSVASARPETMPVFEPLESRDLFSATVVAASTGAAALPALTKIRSAAHAPVTPGTTVRTAAASTAKVTATTPPPAPTLTLTQPFAQAIGTVPTLAQQTQTATGVVATPAQQAAQVASTTPTAQQLLAQATGNVPTLAQQVQQVTGATTTPAQQLAQVLAAAGVTLVI